MIRTHAGDLFNILLGVCAFGYSFMPQERVRNYRRGVALAMRIVGIILISVSSANIVLSIANHS